MDQPTITCPKCGAELPLTEAISKQIQDRLRKQYDAEAEQQKKALAAREQAVETKEGDLKRREETIVQTATEELERQKEKLLRAAAAKAGEALALEMADLKARVKEKDEELATFHKEQLQLMKEKRAIEDREARLELDVARRLDEERKQISQKASEEAVERFRLVVREKDEKIERMVDQIDEMKRRAEQGSQQLQGEVLELELEDMLREVFRLDSIAPVPKGMRGADVTQRVLRGDGRSCGTILWECKRTKAWSNSWIEKIKDNQREVGAEIAVIASEVLPDGVACIGVVDGVWVTGLATVIGLGTALRTNLIELANVRATHVGKEEKMEALYNYLSSPQFKQRVEGIVEAFRSLNEELDREKRAMSGIWARREKQIERVIANTTGMYGDMQAIAGASMQQIEALNLTELPGPGDGVDVLEILPEESRGADS
jgi:hypothetical protein